MAVRAEAKAGIVTSRPRDGFQWVVGIVASAVPALLLLIVLTLLQQAMPAIQHFGLAFVVNTDWNPVTENFGAAPAIFGTVFTAFLALALALPVGVAVAVVLAEPGHTTLRGFVRTGIELLAAITSPVYRVLALYVLAPWSYQHIEVPISEHAGFIGWLGSPPGRGLFNPPLGLAVMILPTPPPVPPAGTKNVPRGFK